MNATGIEHSEMKREGGFSLVETMVATTMLTVVLLSTFMIYERLQRAYVTTQNVATNQDRTRAAFGRIVMTLRSAGENVNPTGDQNLTDEQIEAAFESAIVVRGDYDFERETGLEGTGAGEHQVVTTGNDEIVGFILEKPGANTQNFNVIADLTGTGGKRDNSFSASAPQNEETVSIATAATSLAQQTGPPYSLYRVSFDSAGNVTRQLITDDVFRLTFHYYDKNGTAIAASALGSADSERAARRDIRRIEVQLTGMTDVPDPSHADPQVYVPAPPASARMYRKLMLSAQVMALNLGKKGSDHGPVPASSLTPPTDLTVCTGHCNKLILTWPAVTGVSSYQVRAYSAASPVIDQTIEVSNATELIWSPSDPARNYEFTVRSWNTVNNTTSAFANPVYATCANGNTPAAPSAAVTAAQNGLAYSMAVSWPAVTDNAAALVGTCTSASGAVTSIPAPRDRQLLDFGNYTVHRERSTGSNSAFAVGAGNRIDSAAGNTPPGTATSLMDNTAAPCEQYFYRVAAVDACGLSGAASPAMAAVGVVNVPTGVNPVTPASLTAVPAVTNNGIYYTVPLAWTAVTAATDGKAATIARYVITRERQLTGQFTYSLDTAFGPSGQQVITDQTTFTDTAPMTSGGLTAKYRYTVKARFNCSTLRDSAASSAYLVPCATSGTAQLTSPVGGATIAVGTTQPIVISVTGTWNRADVFVKNPAGTVVASFTNPVAVTNGNFTFNWNTTGLPDADYTIETVMYQGLCSKSLTPIVVNLDPAGGCFVVTTSSYQSSDKSMAFTIRNGCAAAQTINAMTPTWCCGPNNAVTTLTKIKYIGSDIYDAATDSTGGSPAPGQSGHKCPLTTNITLNGGATSQTITLDFSHEMKAASGTPKSTLDPVLLHSIALPAGQNVGPITPP